VDPGSGFIQVIIQSASQPGHVTHSAGKQAHAVCCFTSIHISSDGGGGGGGGNDVASQVLCVSLDVLLQLD
jgi:hypothetical protein